MTYDQRSRLYWNSIPSLFVCNSEIFFVIDQSDQNILLFLLFHSSSDKYKINRYYEQTPKSKDKRLMWIIKGELNPSPSYKMRRKNSPFFKGGFSGIINICKMERFDLVKHYRF